MDTQPPSGPGGPPPLDPELATALAAMPARPDFTRAAIPLLRESVLVRPSDEELRQDGAFDVAERTVPDRPWNGPPQRQPRVVARGAGIGSGAERYARRRMLRVLMVSA